MRGEGQAAQLFVSPPVGGSHLNHQQRCLGGWDTETMQRLRQHWGLTVNPHLSSQGPSAQSGCVNRTLPNPRNYTELITQIIRPTWWCCLCSCPSIPAGSVSQVPRMVNLAALASWSHWASLEWD